MQPLSSFFRKLPFTFLLAFTLILIGSLVFTAPGFQAGFSEGQESPLKSLGELGRGLEDSKRPGAGSSDNPNNVTLAATDRGVFSISTQQQANPTVAISGTVRKPDTNALAGATVLFIALNPQSSPTLGFTTNNQGQYSGNIPEGPNFDVDVIAPRPNVNPTLRVPFIALINASGGAITKGGQTLPNNVLDIAMVPGVPVQGNVSDQNNVGIPDFFVLLKGQNDQGQFTAQKSITISEGGAAAGNFTLAAPQTSATYQVSLAKTFITNVAAASGVVGFDLPSPTSVTVTQTDITFTKNPSFLLIKVTAGISLVGKVRDKNNVGIANVFVQAFDAATEFGAPVGNASTGSDGSFSISVPSTTANYRLEAFPDPSLGFTVPPPRFASVAPDAQGNLVQSPTQVVFTLGGGTLLKGSVKKSDGTAVTQGVFVSVDREGGQPAGGGPLDSQGKFSVAVPQTSASYLVRLFVTDTTALAGQSPPSPQRVVITEPSTGVFSQTPAENDLVLQFTEGASITGSVKSNGTGVPGVFVAGFPAGPRTGPPPFGTSTDKDGNFSLSVPKSSASYQLEVFIPPGAAVDVVPPPPTPVSITVNEAGQVTQDPATLIITVQAGFSVKGKVLKSDGTGVSGVFVDLRDPKTGIGSGGGTDSQGNFSVSVPQTAATYRAQVFVPPGAEALAPPPAQTVTVTVVAGQLTQSPTQENLVFTLGAAFAITGKVQAAGQGVAGVFVAAFATPRTGFGPPNFGAQTNQEGQFSVAVPQSAATYEVEVFFDPNNPALAGLVRPATPTRVEVTVTAGTASQNPTAANLIITLGAGFTVKGKVVKSDGTTGVANVFVQLFQRGQLGGMPAGAPTGSNGNFSIAVPQTAAVYEVHIFMPPEVTGLAPPPPTTVTVSEVAGQLTQSPSESQLVITLGAGFSLTGSVVDSSNNGIRNVFVAVAPIGQFGPPPFGNITESNGSFSVSIPKSVATYEVQVFVPPQFGGSALVPPPPTKVTISEPTTGTFTQSPDPLVITMGAGFAVKGKVVKSDNSPVANVFVGLRKRGGGFGPPLGAPTQSDGSFSINVPQTAAKYDLEVFVPPEAGTLAPPPATQVTVSTVGNQLTQSPSEANLVIVLGAGFELKGRVVDSNNSGVANVFVAVFIGGGRFGPPAFGDLTGPNGDFSIAAPRTAASYELQVFVPPGTTAGLVPPKATVVNVSESSGTFSQDPDPLVITMGAGFAVKGSVKKSNGDPVRNVFVALHRFGEFGPPLGGPTDGEGKFSIAVPQTAAVFEVTVFLPPEAAANLAPPPPTQVTVAVVTGQLTQSPSESQLVITLGAGFSLKGAVKDGNGSGIADVFVAAFVGGGRTGPPPFGNVTNFDGAFSISVPDSTATYQLEVFLPPGTTTALVPPAPTVVKVTKGTPTTQSPDPLVITLGSGFSVKGSVKTSGGTGIPDIFVNLIPKGEAPGGPLLGTLTDIAGNFSISVPQTSKTYSAQVFLPFKEVGNLAPPPPTDVRVIETSGTFSQSPDPLNLIVAAGLSLTGSVVDPNNVGVPNVFVAAFTSSGRTGPPPFGNITDSSGAFSIAIPQTSRTYELEVFLPPGATTALVPPRDVTKVTITQSGSTFTQNPSPLKITMSTGFSVKGKVVDSGGSGVNGVFVNLVQKGVLVPGPPSGASSDSDGKFSIAVPQTAATYTTQVFVPPHLGANIAPPPPVDVVVSKTNNTFSQSPTEDNLVLTLQTGFQIKGSAIRSDTNTGLEDVFVGLFVGSARTGPPPFGDLTDSGGKFAIAVPTTARTYEAEAFLPPDSPLLGQLTRPAAREVTVTVTGGTASQNPTEANLVLAFGAGSAIKGSVTGLGDTDAFVEFARVGGGPAERFGGLVEDDGTFSVAAPNTSATYQGQVFLLNPTATQSPPPPRVVEVTFVNNVFSQNPTQANLVFAVATGIPVTVTVLANNSPVSDVFVNVQNTGTNESLGGLTDSKGKITLSVPDRAATWSVSLILNTAQFATPVPQTFTVANSVATPNSITFNLVSGVQITGSVKQGTTGIQGAFVNFSDTQTATRQFGTATDKNGNFSIALPTTDATYQASVFLPPGLNLVRPDPVSVVVSATSATPSTINFAVSPGILYTGVVQKTDTTPVFGVFVELVAASNGKKFGGVSLGNGKFSIALPTGNDTYTVNVFVPSALGLTAQAAGPVTVTAGTPSPSTLTITLQ